MGARHHLQPHQRRLTAHDLGKHPIQNLSSPVVVTIARYAGKVMGSHLLVAEGLQHPRQVLPKDPIYRLKLILQSCFCFVQKLLRFPRDLSDHRVHPTSSKQTGLPASRSATEAKNGFSDLLLVTIFLRDPYLIKSLTSVNISSFSLSVSV